MGDGWKRRESRRSLPFPPKPSIDYNGHSKCLGGKRPVVGASCTVRTDCRPICISGLSIRATPTLINTQDCPLYSDLVQMVLRRYVACLLKELQRSA